MKLFEIDWQDFFRRLPVWQRLSAPARLAFAKMQPNFAIVFLAPAPLAEAALARFAEQMLLLRTYCKSKHWQVLTTKALATGCLACGAAIAAETAIECAGLVATFDASTGMLTLRRGGHAFASGQFAQPGRGQCSIERLAADAPFGPGPMLKIAPGENRVVIREGTPLVLLRRDPCGVAAPPGNRVEVVRCR